MQRNSALLLALLATAGCASQHRPYGELTVAPAPRTIVGVDVTNTFDRSIDVYYSTQFLGTLAPFAHKSFTVPPTTGGELPIYAQWTGSSQRQMNISGTQSVRYVYQDPAPRHR
jgi:hypothetical protein